MEHHSWILAISVTIKSVTNSRMVLVFCCYLWPICNLLIGFLKERRAGLKTSSNAFFFKQKGSQTNRSDQIRSVTQSCPTLRPHESQHARLPCPSPTPGVHSDSHPSSH